MTDKLTPQQETFLATAEPGNRESIALRARAGTGKTYSLRGWASSAKGGGLATSFSKSTVMELGNKMPTKFQCKTQHGLGYAAIRSSGKFTQMDSSKIFNLVGDFGKDNDIDFRDQGDLRKLISLAKTFGIQPDRNGPEGLIQDTYDNWEQMAENFDIDIGKHTIEHARHLLKESNHLALKEGTIDFDDMLYISLLWPHRFPRYPTILADEVQDFNSLQHLMLRRLLLPNGRLIAAGDDRQAIYAFRGALADSYTQLVQDFGMTELPLTVSFRCPRAVVLEAQQYVPDIEPAPGAIEGSVTYPSSLALADVPKTVLCRNNAPLIRLALALLVSGRTVEVAGQDIGKGLVTLTKRITKKNLPSQEFQARLTKWRDRETAKYPRRKGRINDKFMALHALSQHHRDLAGIQKHLSELYPNLDNKNRRPADVHLTTIHRAKGREWPQVLFLDPQLLPSEYATSEQDRLQEANLAYVGVTRAQEELVYCPSHNIEGLEE